MVVVEPKPVDAALGEDLLVARADGDVDAALGKRRHDVLRERPLGHEVKPPAVVDAVGHADGLEVGLAGILAGVGRREAVDEADLGVRANRARGLEVAKRRHAEAVRQGDAVLHAPGLGEVVVEGIPGTEGVAVLGLHDRLVEREPVLDLAAELLEGRAGVVAIGLDDLAAVPAAATEEVGRHVEVVQAHEGLKAGLLGVREELVVVGRTLGVDTTVSVHEARPLDRGAPRGQAEVTKDGEVLVVTVGEVVARIRPHPVVEVLDPLVGPGIPQIVDLSEATPGTLGLRARHGGTKEKVCGKLAHLQRDLLSILSAASLFESILDMFFLVMVHVQRIL